MASADIKAGRAYVELYLKNREFLRGLRNARERVRRFASDIRAAGQAMAALGGVGLVGIGLASKKFADFDDQMRAVKGVTQASQVEFEKLTEKAKALGASTSYTAVQVAALMAELGRAGFKPDQIEEMTGAVLDLARATQTDATLASGIMAASIRQFSLAAGDATRVADALTAAANGSFNTVEQLGEALSYAGPVANDFNMTIEETLAVLGALGNVGIQGSNAGTAVRRLLTLTGAEAEKLQGIFGVTFTDAAGNARPLVDVLHEVNEATAGLGTADRAKKFNEAFGLLGITGASAIARNAQGAKELLDAIEGAGGQASKTAKEMDAGLGGSLRMMLSAIEGVGIAIGESLAKPLAGLMDIIQRVASASIKWIEVNQDAVVAVAAVAGGVAATGVVLLTMGASILAVNGAMSVLASTVGLAGAAFTVLLAPLRMALIGFAAIRGTLITLTAAVATARAAIITMGAAIFSVRTATIAAGAAIGVFRAAVLAAATAVFTLRVGTAALVAVATVTRGVFVITTAAISAYRTMLILARTATITLVGASTALTVVTKAAQGSMLALRGTALALVTAQKALLVVTGSLRATFVLSQGAVIAITAAVKSYMVVTAAARTFVVSFRAALIGLRAAFVGVASGAILAKVAMVSFTAVGALLSALTSPMVLVAAGLAAVGYMAYQAIGGFNGLSAVGRSALGGLGEAFTWFTSTIIPTFMTAFGGISDAIMGGNWALAGQVAMAGLQVAFLQGTAALSGIFGEFIGKIGAQIAGGDFAGAWNSVVLQMSETWARFSEGVVNVFTQAARAVIDAWEAMQAKITNTLLETSAGGGVMGSIASSVLGVDMAEEQKRSDRLNAQLGLRQQDITEDAKGVAGGMRANQFSAGREFLDEMDRAANAGTRAASGAAAANTAGAAYENDAALAEARAELARLREEARQAAMEAKALSDQQKQQGREAAAGAAAGAAGPGGMSGRIVGSFSAAALSALGSGESPMQRIAQDTLKEAKQTREEIKELRRIDERLLQEVRNGGLIA